MFKKYKILSLIPARIGSKGLRNKNVKKFFIIRGNFSIENGMLTPTLKLKRKEIIKNYKQQLENLY